MDEKILLGLLIFIFVLFFIISRIAGSPLGYKAKMHKFEPIITEGGIGSLLAGTFFGIIREVLLKRKPNFQFTLIIMLMFFCWYILFKGLAYFSNNESSNVLATGEDNSGEEITIKDIKNEIVRPSKLSPMYSVFVSSIIILLVIILIISFYAQKNEGNDQHIVSFNILMSVMVILAGFFTIITGKKLNIDTKIKILSYTMAYALIFGILGPIFIFKSFTFTNLIISTLIVFVWLSLTFSFSNFLTPQLQFINRI